MNDIKWDSIKANLISGPCKWPGRKMELLFLLPPGLIYCLHNEAHWDGWWSALIFCKKALIAANCLWVLEQVSHMPSAKSLSATVKISHSLPRGEHFERRAMLAALLEYELWLAGPVASCHRPAVRSVDSDSDSPSPAPLPFASPCFINNSVKYSSVSICIQSLLHHTAEFHKVKRTGQTMWTTINCMIV